MAQKKQPTKSREWVAIHYKEDGSIHDLIRKLKSRGIKAFISPLHTPDPPELLEEKTVDEIVEEGLAPKEHYHILFIFDGPRSITFLGNLMPVLKITHPFQCGSVTAYARYLVHLDDPDKQQWKHPFDEVITVGYLNYKFYASITPEKIPTIYDITQFCRIQGIVQFNELLDYAFAEEPEWVKIITNNANLPIITAYLNSLRFSTLHPDR